MVNGDMEISLAPCAEDCTGCTVGVKRGIFVSPFFPQNREAQLLVWLSTVGVGGFRTGCIWV